MAKQILILLLGMTIFMANFGLAQDTSEAIDLPSQEPTEKIVIFRPGDVLHFNDLDKSGKVTPIQVISEPLPSPYAECTVIQEGAGNRTIVLNDVKVVKVARTNVDTILTALQRAGVCSPDSQ